jgi:hypothetical protein
MDGRRSPAFAGGPDSVEDRYFDQREAISTQPVLEPCLYLMSASMLPVRISVRGAGKVP